MDERGDKLSRMHQAKIKFHSRMKETFLTKMCEREYVSRTQVTRLLRKINHIYIRSLLKVLALDVS